MRGDNKMDNNKPQPLSFEEYIKTVTMLYVNPKLEKEFSELVQSEIKSVQVELKRLTTFDGLKRYIRDNAQSLDRITSILNVSEEKFKRIVKMFRLERNHMPTGEWSIGRIRRQMVEDPEWMNDICNLLMYGKDDDKYKGVIPHFYLENFCINETIIERLSSEDDIRNSIKKGLEGKYNNRLGDTFFNEILENVSALCGVRGLTWKEKENVPLAGRTVAIAIPDSNHPRILIDVTYGITTSSAQTRYAETIESLGSKLRDINKDRDEQDKIIYINIIDGAGWVARQSDLSKIHRCSHYLLNLKTVSKLAPILDFYLN